MPHNLYRDPLSGQISMMYNGGTPWHELGTPLDAPANSDEAMRKAHLDWCIEKYPLEIDTPAGYQTITGQYAIMRTDLWRKGCVNPILGIVSEEYQPFQNHEAFQFFDDIVGEKAAIYETAGALGNGERVWILAKLPGEIHVIGDDTCDKYLLLSNSHDGKSSVQIKFTPIRVVCQNTLTLALSNGLTVRVSHIKNMRDRIRQTQELLGIIQTRFEGIETDFKIMTKVQMDASKIDTYLRILFPDPQDKDDQKGIERAKNERRIAKIYFEEGRGNTENGVKGTLWAAYNGVTEMVDHHRAAQKDPYQHLNYIGFGDGYMLKARAFRTAMDHVKTWAV